MHPAMGDPGDYSELSEEKTEPFSQTEILARLNRFRAEELQAITSTVPLDDLVVPPDQDIRILMRPLARGRSVSPGEKNLTWLALHAEVAEPEDSPHRVLAVRQTFRDISFTVTIPDQQRPDRPLCCDLYYDPASDHQVLVNRSDIPFTLSRVSQEPEGNRGEQYEVNPSFSRALAPGTWRINMDGTDLLDFRILEKRPLRLRAPSSSGSDSSGVSELVNSTGKRSFVADEDEPLNAGKRRRSSDSTDDKNGDDGLIMFLPAKTNPLVFPLPKGEKGKELTTTSGHALLDMQYDDTLEVPPGAELVGYTITKKDPIASTSLSSVFTAEHSEVPSGVIVVKVLKTRSPATVNNEGAAAKDVVRQAHIWLREFQSQESLEHRSIVRLYGADARYLSLYMEHVDARDLSSRGTWRTNSHTFAGDRSDALSILRDIANALHYIHGKGLVHNDIKPGNILYSRERGAVLCDLGLSTRARGFVSAGGTPWYVPPEFIGLKQRGAPSDVWALGVTMLYVLGKIQWPDARAHKAHPKHLHWMIAQLNSKVRAEQLPAVSSMRLWLNEVNAVRAGLNTYDKLERLVHGMLAPNPKERVTTKEIVNQLFTEELPEK